jgi:hypothetical protein
VFFCDDQKVDNDFSRQVDKVSFFVPNADFFLLKFRHEMFRECLKWQSAESESLSFITHCPSPRL